MKQDNGIQHLRALALDTNENGQFAAAYVQRIQDGQDARFQNSIKNIESQEQSMKSSLVGAQGAVGAMLIHIAAVGAGVTGFAAAPFILPASLAVGAAMVGKAFYHSIQKHRAAETLESTDTRAQIVNDLKSSDGLFSRVMESLKIHQTENKYEGMADRIMGSMFNKAKPVEIKSSLSFTPRP